MLELDDVKEHVDKKEYQIAISICNKFSNNDITYVIGPEGYPVKMPKKVLRCN